LQYLFPLFFCGNSNVNLWYILNIVWYCKTRKVMTLYLRMVSLASYITTVKALTEVSLQNQALQ
jgi:hypothetical protein